MEELQEAKAENNNYKLLIQEMEDAVKRLRDKNYNHEEKMASIEVQKLVAKKNLALSTKDVQTHKVKSQLFGKKRWQIMRLKMHKKKLDDKEVRKLAEK